MKMRIVLLFLMGLSWVSAQADIQNAVDPRIDAQFKAFYYSSQIDPRLCGANIDAFVRHLSRTGALPADFKRVVIRAPKSTWHMANMLIALKSRFGRLESGHQLDFWYFHVIGVHENKVYDFSFNHQPRVLPREQYFREMFIPRTPFMIFGSTFRIGGKGPYYGPEDGRQELADYRFEVSRVSSTGTVTPVRDYNSLREYLGRLE